MMTENIRFNMFAPRKVDSKLAKEIDSGSVSIAEPTLPKMKKNEVSSTLQDYQDTYGKNYPEPIITQRQGEPSFSPSIHPTAMHVKATGVDTPVLEDKAYPTRTELVKSCHMKIRESIHFVIEDPTFDEGLLHLLGGNRHLFLDKNDWDSVSQLDKGLNKLVKLSRNVRGIDFQGLREPRHDYAEQISLKQHRIDMASACLLYYSGEVSSLVRFCGGEFTAAHRDSEKLIREIEPHVEEEDIKHIKRIMNDGCPAELKRTFTKASKMELLRKGNLLQVADGPYRTIAFHDVTFAT